MGPVKWIPRRSVIEQKYPYKEHIIIDGGSTDSTLKVLQRYSEKIAYWVSEHDGGIYDAMNKGIALSRGRYIKLLNGDDMLSPDSIAKAISVFQGTADSLYVTGNMELIDDADRRIEIDSKGPIFHPSWYVSRQVYEQAGLYRTDLKVSSDYEFFLRLKEKKIETRHLDEVLIRFRVGGISAGFTGVTEGFKIHCEYRNVFFAIHFAFRWFLRKSRHWLLRRLLGQRGLNSLKRALRA